jgi:hypothetical protein
MPVRSVPSPRPARRARAVLLVAAATLLALPAAGQAAGIAFTGPATVEAQSTLEVGVTVDPTGIPDEPAPLFVAKAYPGGSACPAGPDALGDAETVPAVFSTTVLAEEGVQQLRIPLTPARAGALRLCGWLAQTPLSATAYVGPQALDVTVTPKVPFRAEPTVTAAWGYNARRRRCRVAGEVTPRGTGRVALQRRTGSRWRTVTTFPIRGTRYAGWFSGRKRQRYRVSYAGSATLLPATSLEHRVTRRSTYEC